MTTSDGKPIERASSTVRRPLALGLFAVVPAGLMLLGVSVPGGDYFGALSLALVLWLLEISLWVGGVVAVRRTAAETRRWRAWAIAPVILTVSCAVALAGLPLAARFEMSRAAFEQLPSQSPSPDDLVTVGLYQVCCYEKTDFGYQFSVNEGLLKTWGFAYSPNGPPAGPDIDDGPVTHLQGGEQAYRHLTGPWYIWEFKYS